MLGAAGDGRAFFAIHVFDSLFYGRDQFDVWGFLGEWGKGIIECIQLSSSRQGGNDLLGELRHVGGNVRQG